MNAFRHLLLGLGCVALGHAASISTDQAYTENFDSMDSSLELPASWRVSFSDAASRWDTGATSTTYEASSGTPAQDGIYNFGVTNTTDRAPGVFRSTLGSNNNLMLQLTNSGTTSFDTLYVSYSVEKYRSYNTDVTVKLYVSSDGVTWQQASSTPYYWFQDTPFDFSGSVSTTVLNSVVATGTIQPGASLFLRWNVSFHGPKGAAGAIDNVVISTSPIPEHSTYATVAGFAMLGAALLRRRRH